MWALNQNHCSVFTFTRLILSCWFVRELKHLVNSHESGTVNCVPSLRKTFLTIDHRNEWKPLSVGLKVLVVVVWSFISGKIQNLNQCKHEVEEFGFVLRVRIARYSIHVPIRSSSDGSGSGSSFRASGSARRISGDHPLRQIGQLR